MIAAAARAGQAEVPVRPAANHGQDRLPPRVATYLAIHGGNAMSASQGNRISPRETVTARSQGTAGSSTARRHTHSRRSDDAPGRASRPRREPHAPEPKTELPTHRRALSAPVPRACARAGRRAHLKVRRSEREPPARSSPTPVGRTHGVEQVDGERASLGHPAPRPLPSLGWWERASPTLTGCPATHSIGAAVRRRAAAAMRAVPAILASLLSTICSSCGPCTHLGAGRSQVQIPSPRLRKSLLIRIF